MAAEDLATLAAAFHHYAKPGEGFSPDDPAVELALDFAKSFRGPLGSLIEGVSVAGGSNRSCLANAASSRRLTGRMTLSCASTMTTLWQSAAWRTWRARCGETRAIAAASASHAMHD